MNVVRSSRNWLPLLLIAVMSTCFYFPVLFQNQTQIHAEGVSLGMALMHMLSSAIKGDSSMLWTTGIYGGHPIFAEGQGGFANPLHLLIAWLLPPIPGYNLHQFLSMFLSGVGTYGMCRSQDCSRAASAFAALALIFSTLWIGGRSNLAIGSTIGWVPWAFWGLSTWLKRADLPSACFFGATMALMVLSGYPQVVHGVLIYMTLYLAVKLFYAKERELLVHRRGRLAFTLVVAILLCVGLSAVQLLPLLELARESHRNDGISILTIDDASTAAFMRGFLYTFNKPGLWPNTSVGAEAVYFTATGSLFVSLVFSILIFFRRSAAGNAHLVATLFLVLLGFGTGGSPLFRLIYDWHLIPGLHNFRVVFTYLYVALAGFALLCAFSLDALAGVKSTDPALRSTWRPVTRGVGSLLLISVWVVIWAFAIWYLHVDDVSISQYAIPILWLICCVAALALGYQNLLPAIALLLLCVEIFAFRVDSYDFGSSSLIAKPRSIEVLEQRGDLRDFKFYDRTYAATYSFHHPKSPEVVPGLKAMLEAVTPASNVFWDVSSLKGNLALGLKRHSLAEAVVESELRSGSRGVPGSRLIDFMSLKYLTVGGVFDQPGFVEAYANDAMGLRIMDNTHAHPRIQFFDDAIFVPTLEAAVEAVSGLASKTLVIETPGEAPEVGRLEPSQGKVMFKLLRDRPDSYKVEIKTPTATWFFLADPNYPGWSAYLDGKETAVYSAQLLGKAVYIPAGKHVLRLMFKPMSFRIGRVVTIISVCVLALLLLNQIRRRGIPTRSGAA